MDYKEKLDKRVEKERERMVTLTTLSSHDVEIALAMYRIGYMNGRSDLLDERTEKLKNN